VQRSREELAMRIFRFAQGAAEGHAKLRKVLGGKGANLAEMSRLGLPVPPGFTLSTGICRHLLAHGELPPELDAAIDEGVAHVQAATGRRFGDPERPLLLSVRSGAPVSMPGMMDTVLNIGLNPDVVASWAKATGNDRLAQDAWRRFLQMYGDVVLGVGADEEEDPFDALVTRKKTQRGARSDVELTAEDLRDLAADFAALIEERTGAPVPLDPRVQLATAVHAVFESWKTPRAIDYRRLHDLDDEMGTACNVQAMVFGDVNERSATGVVFTRHPGTGEPVVFGEYLLCAQGEDVVAGVRTPDALHRQQAGAREGATLEERMPAVYDELLQILGRLERHFRDVQDVEFTVEEDHLWILQTRAAKRSAAAAVRIAVDLQREGLIEVREAVSRTTPESVELLLHPSLGHDARARAEAEGKRLAVGLPASPGAGAGAIALTKDDAVARAARGEDVVLVREETSADDVKGMHAARAILTARGGMTSHAAVVARGMGRPCVAGCEALSIDLGAGTVRIGDRELAAGDTITVDGTSGAVFVGVLVGERSEPPEELRALLALADDLRTLGVRANADTPEDARRARSFGAEGIGLCRTEHMFFAPERLRQVRAMLLAEDEDGRKRALGELLAFQRDDFAALFEAMEGWPVTIRLLDPPLHEFLPHDSADIRDVAEALGAPVERVRAAAERHREHNPMLGTRGVRLLIAMPEIAQMQTVAILEGALLARRKGLPVDVEIMVPLVADAAELIAVRRVIDDAAERVFSAAGERIPYTVGTMIELPRAALAAEDIAREAAFFSFGTNDLTQTTFGLSRDDTSDLIGRYVADGLLPADPFATVDVRGVGELVRTAIERGRRAKRDLSCGVCGEHGGDPRSVLFFAQAGIDYVSCSPWRVPVARLAAAHAALNAQHG
jgi:pyruvate,orthophosphate dikinase